MCFCGHRVLVSECKEHARNLLAQYMNVDMNSSKSFLTLPEFDYVNVKKALYLPPVSKGVVHISLIKCDPSREQGPYEICENYRPWSACSVRAG